MFGGRQLRERRAELDRLAHITEEAAQRAELFALVSAANFISRPSRDPANPAPRIAVKLEGLGTIWMCETGENVAKALARRFMSVGPDAIRRALQILDERSAFILEVRDGGGGRYERLRGGGGGWL